MEQKQTYERIVPRRCVGKSLAVRTLVYLGYVCFATLWIAPIIRSLFSPAVLALAVLTTLALILYTRKYLHVEYEYAFVGDTLTVAKIYGKRRRKVLLETELKHMLLVAPYTDERVEDVERLSPTKTVDASSAPDSEELLLAVYDEEPDTRVLLVMESDERAIAFFRRHAPHACSRELRSNLR